MHAAPFVVFAGSLSAIAMAVLGHSIAGVTTAQLSVVTLGMGVTAVAALVHMFRD